MVGYLLLIFFGSFDLLTHHGQSPKVKVNNSKNGPPRCKRNPRRPSDHPSTSTKEWIDIEYAESHSDLGDNEEGILMHDDHNIPSDRGRRGRRHGGRRINIRIVIESLRMCSTLFITKARRNDWRKLVYSSSLPPEGILHGKREDEDGDKQKDGEDFKVLKDGRTKK